MARTYGWTLDDIDRLEPPPADYWTGRERVRFMWAVRALHQGAIEHLQQFEQRFEQAQQSLPFLGQAPVMTAGEGE